MKYTESCAQPFLCSNTAVEMSLKGHAELCRARFLTKLEQALIFGLMEEVRTTPKPGLVDLADNGAHRDMCYDTFVSSTRAITPYLTAMGALGYDFDGASDVLFPQLRCLGAEAEKAMFAATEGVNTHKGAIFSLGLLAAGIGYLFRRKGFFSGGELFELCSAAATPWLEKDFEEMRCRQPVTHGEKLFAQYGFRGIRGEALDGFPALRCVGLPALAKANRTQPCANSAQLFILLTLMAQVEDTNILNRAGPSALKQVQAEAQQFIADFAVIDNHALSALAEMNRRFIEQNISPGGCADLLAASLFLGRLEEAGILRLI
ncbi:MAG: triphosphoribosyl-dephospho-CoA synthase CitG [Pygmaiobacter massiliensis]|uniref:triphosphoribosyl-dephospho-CoA synthase CitG n=1 Tax=Pygmaiobacter massiliensis TaxID=1917873 RepID=UPI00289B98BA|nr:triphosphoribosyl-dephospho-CoA synthase CitG [Pygmaiobacter massiliensis]